MAAASRYLSLAVVPLALHVRAVELREEDALREHACGEPDEDEAHREEQQTKREVLEEREEVVADVLEHGAHEVELEARRDCALADEVHREHRDDQEHDDDVERHEDIVRPALEHARHDRASDEDEEGGERFPEHLPPQREVAAVRDRGELLVLAVEVFREDAYAIPDEEEPPVDGHEQPQDVEQSHPAAERVLERGREVERCHNRQQRRG